MKGARLTWLKKEDHTSHAGNEHLIVTDHPGWG
jgi:hypothetical protein